MSIKYPGVRVGDVFGQVEVIALRSDRTVPSGAVFQRVQVRCSCGNAYDTAALQLIKLPNPRCAVCVKAPRLKYRVGDRYGKVVIIGLYYEQAGSFRRMAKCLCDCGKEVGITIGILHRIKTPSCGCAPIASYTGVGGFSGAFFYAICQNAAARGIPVSVSKEQLWSLYLDQQGRCALSGLPIVLGARGRKTASLDRIDSAVAYAEGNLQWVHKDVNKMKQNLAQARFIELCQAISANQLDPAARESDWVAQVAAPRKKPPGRKPYGLKA